MGPKTNKIESEKETGFVSAVELFQNYIKKVNQKLEFAHNSKELKFNYTRFFNVVSQTKNNPKKAMKFIRNAFYKKKFNQLLLEESFHSCGSNLAVLKPPRVENLKGIVFVCSEYRGVSKAGGISVMVADLSEKLALLGEKVIIITPWYGDSDAKGQNSDILKNAKKLKDITI